MSRTSLRVRKDRLPTDTDAVGRRHALIRPRAVSGSPGTMDRMKHDAITAHNRIAWTVSSHRAWVARYGTAAMAAADIVSDPERPLRRLLGFVGDPHGRSIANPLGSHGRIATALALPGADVTVFDLSESNARYARELAAEAGVTIDYVVGDFQISAPRHAGRFDTVVMELGVVHYFVEIREFVASTRALLECGGRLVVNEFHPLLKKCIEVRSGEPVLHGDYFRTELEVAPAPYATFVDGDVPDCVIRRWNLGEIVTAFASGGFRVERLVEHPAEGLARLPGTFTLVATAD